MPCTPTGGLSHSYISRWADLTMLNQPSPLDAPLLDPTPSPARGRGRSRRARKDENESEDGHRQTCSPHPPVTRVIPCNPRTRVLSNRRPTALPNPTLSFRRLAHKQPPTQVIARTPSDVTNRPTTTSTPSSDLIFTMSPVLLDGLSTRRPSRLSAELDVPTPLPKTESWEHPPPPYSTSHMTTSASAALADESSASVIDELVADSIIPMRLHRKSDPVPARLSSVTSASIDTTPARPIPIPKPSPRVPSDYGGVSSVSVSVSVPMFARPPRKLSTKQRPDENALVVVEEPADVTGEWCGNADVVSVPIAITHQRPPASKKKRFFIGIAPGESYDGDMDSESSWR
ncbi:unnamed protein product [Rhizoctonia solani]|uniref:Uncharacterized protein n=1 Tax=Rhizoctonia solani TaxID=456999 RepID=A0A8H2WC03_9AGAM|nr:unnamed protein product [Rhizoctonia solani]